MSKDASPADLAEPSGARVARRISVVLPRVNVLKTVTRSFSAEFCDFLVYAFFLAVFCVVVFGPRGSSNQYYMRQSIDDMYLGNEYDYGISYGDTASLGHVAAAELYRNALERVEQMAEVQDQLEQFLEGIEPRVLAITQMK